jgi:DNA repair protein RecO (recombination protein O)
LSVYGRRAGNQLRTLGSFVGITSFPGLRETPARFHNAFHLAALVLAFAREEQPLPALFELTISALRLLEEADDDEAQALGLGYEAMVLTHLGFGPELTRCVECERPARNIQVTRLSGLRGGLLCRNCRHRDQRAVQVSGLAVASLVGLCSGPLVRALGLPPDPRLRREIRGALDGWTTTVLDRPLRTARHV